MCQPLFFRDYGSPAFLHGVRPAGHSLLIRYPRIFHPLCRFAKAGTGLLPDHSLFNNDKRGSPPANLRVAIGIPAFLCKRVAEALPG